MYELSVERTFCAAHAIMIGGRREPVHGHNWRVNVTVAGRDLDADGLLCDFHLIERILDGVIGPMHNADLNLMPPFTNISPTAEHVARHIATAIAPGLPKRAALRSVSVAEAPGCVATYRPDSA
jgi:6-pyruvoyltetrahydropterin/6-carboxytetrahydropterin synthase